MMIMIKGIGNVKFNADEIWKSSITEVSQKFKNEKKKNKKKKKKKKPGREEFKMRFIEK